MGPVVRGRYRLAAPRLAHPMPHLVSIKAYQAHHRLLTEQQGRQRMHTLNAKQHLQPLEQEVLHARHHRALNPLALDMPHQVKNPQRLQEVEELIQHSAFVQPVHPIDYLFAVEAPGHPPIIAPGRLPTQAFRQVLCDPFPVAL
jgi:hypothetical protein